MTCVVSVRVRDIRRSGRQPSNGLTVLAAPERGVLRAATCGAQAAGAVSGVLCGCAGEAVVAVRVLVRWRGQYRRRGRAMSSSACLPLWAWRAGDDWDWGVLRVTGTDRPAE